MVIPEKSFYSASLVVLYQNTAPSRVMIEGGGTSLGLNEGSGVSLSTSCAGYTAEEITLTCSAMFPSVSGNSIARMTGFYIPMS